MKFTAASLLLLSCVLSFGANISFRGIAEGSHTYSPIGGLTNSSSGGGGGIGSFLVNLNQLSTNTQLTIKDGVTITNPNISGVITGAVTFANDTTFNGSMVNNGGMVYNSAVILSLIPINSLLRNDNDNGLAAVTLSGLSLSVGGVLSVNPALANQTPWLGNIYGSLTNTLSGVSNITVQGFYNAADPSSSNIVFMVTNSSVGSGSGIPFSINSTGAISSIAHAKFSTLGVTGNVARIATTLVVGNNSQSGVAGYATLEVSNAVGSATRPILHAGTNLSNGLTVDTNGITLISDGYKVGTGNGQYLGYVVSATTNFSFGPSGFTNALVIGAGGNVGIGTATPASALQVNGTITFLAGNSVIGITGSDGNTGMSESGGTINLWTSNTKRLSLDANGLTIFNPLQFTASALGQSLDTDISRVSAGVVGIGTGSQGSVAGTLLAATIGIGTTAPTNALDVYGKVMATNGYMSFATNSLIALWTTGWTNTFARNAEVHFDGTAMTYVLYTSGGTPWYTNSAVVGNGSCNLQPGGKILVATGTGVVGYAQPW